MNSHRLWGVALGISLAVNAFCIAALVTNVFAPGPEPGHRPPPLPPEARALFRQIDPRELPGFRDSMDALRQRRGEVRGALTAQPFDADRLAAAFAELRQAEADRAAFAHQKIGEVASRLTPEQRQALAELIGRRRGMPRPPHHAAPPERPPR